MNSLKVTDTAAAAVQQTPNRVSLADIEAAILFEQSGRALDLCEGAAPMTADAHRALSVLTIHLIVMRNGFTVIGKSAPADAANFNAELGAKFAREDAIRQLWPLMGFALRDRLLAIDEGVFS